MKKNGLAIAGFVLSFFGPLALIGLILSILGKKKSKELDGSGAKLALAGIIISSLMLAYVVVWVIVFAAAGAAIISFITSIGSSAALALAAL